MFQQDDDFWDKAAQDGAKYFEEKGISDPDEMLKHMMGMMDMKPKPIEGLCLSCGFSTSLATPDWSKMWEYCGQCKTRTVIASPDINTEVLCPILGCNEVTYSLKIENWAEAVNQILTLKTLKLLENLKL